MWAMQRLSFRALLAWTMRSSSLTLSLWPLELDYIKKRHDSRQTGDVEEREEEVVGKEGKRGRKGRTGKEEKYISKRVVIRKSLAGKESLT